MVQSEFFKRLAANPAAERRQKKFNVKTNSVKNACYRNHTAAQGTTRTKHNTADPKGKKRQADNEDEEEPQAAAGSLGTMSTPQMPA
jgi:hypothetical protein